MKVAVLGRTGMLIRSAREVASRGHTIGVVWTCRSEPHYDTDESEFQRLARDHGAAFVNDIGIGRRAAELPAFGCDVAISVNWMTVLSSAVLSKFPFGVLNAHAGDLPRYRGNACPNWAILNGEERIAVTIHRMTESLDAGPILLKNYLDISHDVYIGDVYDWLHRTVPRLMADAVDGLAAGRVIAQAQSIDPALALRCYPRRPDDGRIDWRESVVAIMRLIRASSRPFAGAFTTLEGKQRVTVWRARPEDRAEPFLAVPGQVCFCAQGDPVIACGDGLLRLTDVDIEGGLSGDEAKQGLCKSLRNRLI